MSGDSGIWDPPFPASKKRRLDTACQLQKETEAAQALADMTAWGGDRLETVNQEGAHGPPATKTGSLETVDQEGAHGPPATKTGSLETVDQEGARETERSAAVKSCAQDGNAGEEPKEAGADGDKVRKSDQGPGTVTEVAPNSATSKTKGILATANVADEEDGRVFGRKRKDPKERRRIRVAEDECSIISVGEEEDEEEEESEDGGGPPQPLKTEQYLEALEAVQLDLEAVNQKARRAFAQLKAKFSYMRRPHLEHRNRIIQNIPGFWVTAFLNHPQLSAMINDRDEDTLSYMTNLQVEDYTRAKSGYKIKFYFNSNPYFLNEVIVKEFQCGSSGWMISHSTPIRWWRGQEPFAHGRKNSEMSRSFFTWFCDHSFPARDRIAEIIKEDLWPNPLQYYLMGEGGENGEDNSETENGDDFVVIVDDDGEDEEAVSAPDILEIIDEEERARGTYEAVEDLSSQEADAAISWFSREEPDGRESEVEDG